MKKIFFQTEDTPLLCGIWHTPGTSTERAVILAHGITDNKDEGVVFVRLAEKLADAGCSVFRFDFRGHGESGGNSVDMNISGELADMDAAITEVKHQGYTTIGLVGASFGGSISVLYTAAHPQEVRALCLVNPVLNYDHTFLHPTLPWIKDKKDHIQKDLDEKGWTELGSKKFHVGKLLFDEMAIIEPYKELSKIAIPTMIIHGTADKHVPYEDSQQYCSLLTSGIFISVENSQHGFHDEPYTDSVINDIVLFFTKHI